MLGQVGPEREGLAAVGATKGFVRAVRLHMRSQIALVRKCLVANVTAEWFFAGVGPQVALEQPGPREALAAVWAAASGPVRPQMHSQSGRAAVGTSAGRTLQLGCRLAGRLAASAAPY